MAEELNFEEILEKLHNKLTDSEQFWNKIIDDLSKRINCELKDAIELESESMAYRQQIIDEKTKYLYNIYKDMPKIKQLRKQQFEFYSAKYPYKTNSSEKTRLIEADLAFYDAKIEYLENHVNFLNESVVTLNHVLWGIKNKIDIYNLTGLEA